MRLYIIRHGDPDYEHDCLTSVGKVEAEALAEYLEYVGIDQIYSSSAGRAIETASYTSRRLGKKLGILDWAKEHSGLLLHNENLPAWDISGQEVRKQEFLVDPNNWSKVSDFERIQSIQNAYNNMVENSDKFLSELGFEREGMIYKIKNRNEQKIAFFCHGGFGKTWLAHLLAIPLPLMWGSFLMLTTSVSTILFEERIPGFACPRCIGFGELPHLYHQKIEPGRNGILANFL